MIRLPALAITLALGLALLASTAEAGLILTGVVDGPRGGGQPKAIELFATTNVSDLSIYGLETPTNSATFSGQQFALTGSAMAGDYLYVAYGADFQTYFGHSANFASSVANVNGDDGIALYLNGSIIDVYGGGALPWLYTDSYAYRHNATGPSTTFNAADWYIPGSDLLDAQGTSGVNGSAGITVPFGTYNSTPEPATLLLVGSGAGLLVAARRRRWLAASEDR